MLGIGYDKNKIVKQDSSKLTDKKKEQLKKFVENNIIFDNLI